jgi:hypothetical protein
MECSDDALGSREAEKLYCTMRNVVRLQEQQNVRLATTHEGHELKRSLPSRGGGQDDAGNAVGGPSGPGGDAAVPVEKVRLMS